MKISIQLLFIYSSLTVTTAFAQKVNFKTQIWPIIEKKCLDCHNDQAKHPQKKKPKSGLQLDTPEMIAKGGGNGPVIIPGKPQESPFYTLASLPSDHEDVMPPKGDLLTKTELQTVKLWIEQGADYGIKLTKYSAPVKNESDMNIYDIKGKSTPSAKPEDVAYFEKKRYFITPVQEENSLLKLDFVSSNSLSPEDFSRIKSISKQLVYLNLAKTNVQDRDLVHLSGCQNLIFLHLENTEITDKGLQSISSLQSLEYLNLYNTKVSDKGLSQLSTLKNLKKIFLWQTKVTKNGASVLKSKNPKLIVNLGD